MNNIINCFRVVSLFMMAVMIAGCKTVPLTSRKQMNLLPESMMVEMGLTNYDAFLKENKLSQDHAQVAMINRTGESISQSAEKFMKANGMGSNIRYFNWQFNLVDSDVPNAWCMPGGKIVFYTGILPLTQDEDGVAVVMGHEVAHAVARHGNERMSQGLLAQMGGIALAVAIEEKPEETKQLFMTAYGLGATVGLILPYSRTHEYEADRIGLVIMAMAGYNPAKAVDFWTRMSQMDKNNPPEFLSTHPSDQNRIDEIKKFLPEAMKYYHQ